MTSFFENQSFAFTDLSGNTATINPGIGFVIQSPIKTITVNVDGFTNGVESLLFTDLYATVEKTRSVKFDTSTPTKLSVVDTIEIDDDDTIPTKKTTITSDSVLVRDTYPSSNYIGELLGQNLTFTEIATGSFSSLGYDELTIEASLLNTTITPALITITDGVDTNTLTPTTWSGTSNKVELTTASGNTEFEVVVSQNPSGSNVLSGTTNLKYNPSTETLSVVNIIATGTEQQTGTLITNILETNIILQRVLYFTTQTITLTTPTILTNGTFYISQYDSGSIVANSIITVNLPALPNDGSLDGFSFQFRKVRGGVNQSSTNWTFNAPSFIIIPYNRTLNAGSGGAKITDSINSFTNRIEIVTISGIGYYCFVES